MRRISSLPTAEFCPQVDRIGLNVESTNSARSTVFHEYCDTGVWPAELMHLPEADREEIDKWRVPMPFDYQVNGVSNLLQYQNAYREIRVALDHNFEFVAIPHEIPQADIEAYAPNVMVVGHLDMAWDIEAHDLIVICDIKSSIHAVGDRTNSLQLHGYGIAMCRMLGRGRYVTSIWDASAGKYYVADSAVEMDGFEVATIKARIRRAASERDGNLRVGTHCSSCWKRTHCPAHLVDVPEGEFKALFSGNATEADIRAALVKEKQLKDLLKRIDVETKAWARLHGPVRSEDGKQWWRCEMRSRSGSLDKKAVAAALGVKDLSDYERETEYEQFGWRNID